MKGHIPGSYQCNQCDKAFSIDNDLKVHMYEHFDEKPCQCNQCDKSFSMHSDLKKHMYKHTGEKPYPCNQCDKAFPIHSDLEMHMNEHTGENRLQCNQCDKTFLTQKTLFIMSGYTMMKGRTNVAIMTKHSYMIISFKDIYIIIMEKMLKFARFIEQNAQ